MTQEQYIFLYDLFTDLEGKMRPSLTILLILCVSTRAQKCDCNNVCKCTLCQCPTQTTYTTSQCNNFCALGKACGNQRCSCPAMPACLSCCYVDCNCSFCTNCANQKMNSKSQCTQFCKAANNAACKKVICECPNEVCPRSWNC